MQDLDVVTGAFGFTGKYITRRLLSMGRHVKTLTGHPDRPNPFENHVAVAPFHFGNPQELTRSLGGVGTLYNTYWIRFPYGQMTFEKAVDNTRTLIKAAVEAGVRKIVHISITNASQDSNLVYFRGKGRVERAIIESPLSYAIVRPTVIFGTEDILINNIAWLLRRFPVFAVFGSGDYQVQPVFVEDVARIAVDAAGENENTVVDAVGPEIYRFDNLVRLIADKIQSRPRIIHVNPRPAFSLVRLLGYLVNDVVLTRDEVEGLMSNLLVSKGPPTGQARLSDWLAENARHIGTSYASELARHYR